MPPAAQSAVKRGREVRLSVSIGKGGQSVPDLVGTGYRDAQVSLARAGLRVGQLAYAPSERVPVMRFASIDADLYRRTLERCIEPGTACRSETIMHGEAGEHAPGEPQP